MQTLSYGYKKPETNDKGPIVFPALQDDIQQLNDHNHNGSNSTQLTGQSIVVQTQALLSTDWVALGSGNYSQTFTLLPGYAYDTVVLNFRDPDGTYIQPSLVKVSNTQATVFTNNPSLGMTVLYGV
jgi:hypothetical protein